VSASSLMTVAHDFVVQLKDQGCTLLHAPPWRGVHSRIPSLHLVSSAKCFIPYNAI
jgi:hypothetical protein